MIILIEKRFGMELYKFASFAMMRKGMWRSMIPLLYHPQVLLAGNMGLMQWKFQHLLRHMDPSLRKMRKMAATFCGHEMNDLVPKEGTGPHRVGEHRPHREPSGLHGN